MHLSHLKPLVVFFIVSLFFIGCSGNGDQNAFEHNATETSPSGIMAMTAGGIHKKGTETDPNDWQIAPKFQGLVKVETAAYPNPVTYNTRFQIQLSIISFQSIVGLNVYAFQQPNVTISSLLYTQQGEIPPGLISIPLVASFAQAGGTGSFGNLYRILIYDGRNRLITYGDVEVQ